MKYLRIFATLIFIAAGALLYFDNSVWLLTPVTITFQSVPFYEIPPIYTTNGFAIASVFLLGALFALIHSSLNFIDLIGKNRKISRLESQVADSPKDKN